MNIVEASRLLDDLLTSWQIAVNQGPLTAPVDASELVENYGMTAVDADEYIALFDPVDALASYERKQAQLEAVTWLLNRARAFDVFLSDLAKTGERAIDTSETGWCPGCSTPFGRVWHPQDVDCPKLSAEQTFDKGADG